jgi:hypothetical protein
MLKIRLAALRLLCNLIMVLPEKYYRRAVTIAVKSRRAQQRPQAALEKPDSPGTKRHLDV